MFNFFSFLILMVLCFLKMAAWVAKKSTAIETTNKLDALAEKYYEIFMYSDWCEGQERPETYESFDYQI